MNCSQDGCACTCHVPLAKRLEAVGLSLDSLTATELALVDALLPPGEWRGPERLAAAAGWQDVELKWAQHLIRTNIGRIRPVLHRAGWDLLTLVGMSCYRIERCRADRSESCPRAPKFVAAPRTCLECGTTTREIPDSRARRCNVCLQRWRTAHSRHVDLPRCEVCRQIVSSVRTTICKSCRRLKGLHIRLCEDCAVPISLNAQRCLSCASRLKMHARLEAARLAVAV
jgi:hypothetical protein